MKILALLLVPALVQAHTLPRAEVGCMSIGDPVDQCLRLPKGTHYSVLDTNDDYSIVALQDPPYVGVEVYVDSGEIRSGL
jgi:hypothetical protein